MNETLRPPSPDDLLSHAEAALRRVPIPEGPWDETAVRILAAVQAAAAGSPGSRPPRRTALRWLARVAAVLVVGAALFYATESRLLQPALAFGEVAQKLRDAHSLAYRVTVMSPHMKEPVTTRFLFKEPGLLRSEGPDRQVGITDLRQGKTLILEAASMSALLLERKKSDEKRPPAEDGGVQWLERLRKLAAKQGEPIGKKRVGDIEAQGFRVKDNSQEFQEMTVWADPETKLPVLIEFTVRFADQDNHIAFSDFEFDPVLDEALFRLEPPKGYVLRKAEMETLSPEDAVVRLLRMYAETSGGTFPPRLDDWAAYDKVLPRKRSKRVADLDLELIQAVVRVAMFVQERKRDYGYEAKGVKLGDAGKIIFWYRPKGADSYRVVYGDLRVESVTADRLPAKPKQLPKRQPPTSRTETGDHVVVTGRVLGPDGKPVSGAKVYVSTYTAKDQADPKVRATSGPDGRFRFPATRSEVNVNERVAAAADGYGPDWCELAGLDKSSALPPLRLVRDDVPITGRVLDLENQPIRNATVRLVRVRKMPGEDLTPWIKDLQAAGSNSLFNLGRTRLLLTYERVMQPVWGVLGVPHSVKTGVDGRFRLSGFGRERVVELAIEGPALEQRRVSVMTRMDSPKGMPPFTYGARFDHRAAPAKPIIGTVRDKRTGRPAAGVEVSCVLVSGSGALTDVMPVAGTPATTDEKGRYRLAGTPKSKQYHLAAAGGPYFGAAQIVNDSAGLEPITADFELERGILVRGRLTDKATGRPVRGSLYYLPSPDNPRLKDYPKFSQVSVGAATSEKDGSFAVAVVPGPGLMCARALEDRFVRAEFDGHGSPPPVLLQFVTFHAIRAIGASEKDPKSRLCEIALDPGRTLSGTLLGPGGGPLTGAFAAGLTAAYSPAHGSSPKPKLPTAVFTAVALSPGRPRTLVFWHEEKKLAKAVLVRGNEPGPLTVRLEPLGAVTGLLRDAEGRPEVSAKVEARYSSRQDGTLPGELSLGSPGFLGIFKPALPLPRATTGKDGRFRLQGLVPGMQYEVFAQTGKKTSRLARGFSVAGGECKDLGETRAEAKPGK
ncbi:MAG TPA: hypothetical protein VG013_24400 [Gemmataceae bacterium]|jgi:outer membrane lipoprotein-sorting protein|nr:hypothetical protein [Gemmataceae bacterium]